MIPRPPRSTLFPYTNALPIFTDRDRRYVGPSAEALAPLSAPYGVWAILGNHDDDRDMPPALEDRKSTRLNSSHITISYAVFCLKKKKKSRKHSVPRNIRPWIP